MKYEELEMGFGSLPLCQPDEWWPEERCTAAYGIGESKRVKQVEIRESDLMGRIVLSPTIEDFVKVGPNAEKRLDKKILKRREALFRRGCTRVVKFVRQRAIHGDDLFEHYSMLGLISEAVEIG